MKMKKWIKRLKGYLPISKREYDLGLVKLQKIIHGILQAEAQHSQMEMNIIKHMNTLTRVPVNNPKEKTPKIKSVKDVSIQ